MKIERISHRSLAEAVAGKLVASLMDGSLKSGTQLPPERELIVKFGISRTTLREALKMLENNNLIEARPNVGWFALQIDESNLTQAKEMAGGAMNSGERQTKSEPPTGPIRVPIALDKPIHIPNLKKDRLGTFDFISWWDREKVQNAKVMVVGAGALGNEVIKNLALMGIGNIFIVDFDKIELANLSRSVLFRETDNNRSKAEIAAARAKSVNPSVKVQYINGDITTKLGLGIFRRMDVIIGCLDNREARLAVNRFCYWINKPWVDGAIQELLGLVRVFVPGQGACYECTLTEQALKDLSLRYSCPLLARQNILLGKVPTTPTIASIIGAMQSQEALKIINNMPIQPGKVTHFNGMVNDMHTTAYSPRDDCESHWTYGEITELPARVERTTLDDLLRIACADLGLNAIIELDQELVTKLECPTCHTVEEVLRPLSEVTLEAGNCPTCGILREASMTHVISGDEPFLHRTLASVGVPALHIVRAHNGQEYRFYELTGDLADALHFRDFESTVKLGDKKPAARVKIKEVKGSKSKDAKLHIKGSKEAPLRLRNGRVRLRD